MNKYRQTISIVFIFIIILSYTLSGCNMANKNTYITVSDYKLNTFVSVTAYGTNDKELIQDCLNLCDYYENMFSRTKESSTLAKVNSHELSEIPSELAELISCGIRYSELSEGSFDLSVGSVSSLWDFTSKDPVVPSQNDITKALTHVDYKNITLSQSEHSEDIYTIQIPDGTMIDLGAIAKGYIADRLKDYLLDHGIKSAVINLGGNVLCVGDKAGSGFNIAVKKPFSESGETIATLSIKDKSVVSSGTYERYFKIDNVLYHHILNPSTGYPYNNGLLDVTIISDKSVDGDCLSTTCFTLGLEKGMEIIESMENTEAIFVTEDGKLHYSSGASKYIIK